MPSCMLDASGSSATRVVPMTHASAKQKAHSFALAHNLGYEAEVVKQRAKQRFGLASFNDLTTAQLSDLIDRSLAVQARREHKSTTDDADQLCRLTKAPAC